MLLHEHYLDVPMKRVCMTFSSSLQLRLHIQRQSYILLRPLLKILHIYKLLKILQTLGIRQSRAHRNLLPRNNLLDRQLHLLPIDRDGDLKTLKDMLRHMPRRQTPPDRRTDLPHERRPEPVPGPHEHEEEDALVRVLRPALADADRVRDGGDALDDAVDLGGPEAHARGVEHAVRAAQELDAAGVGVELDEVALRPDICVASTSAADLARRW